jgi:hypothetical protein
MLSEKIKETIRSIIAGGPDRVVINASGEATSSTCARNEYKIAPTVIFVRDDGWSLGAPEQFRHVARDMWSDKWVAKLTWDGGKWLSRPVVDGEVVDQLIQGQEEVKMEIQTDSAGNEFVEVGNIRITLVLAEKRDTEKDWAGSPVLRIQAYRDSESKALFPGAEYPVRRLSDVSEMIEALLALTARAYGV